MKNNIVYHENSEFIKNLLQITNRHKNITIVSHENADPDAFGSAIGLKYFLTKFCSAEIDLIFPQLNKITEQIRKRQNEQNKILDYQQKWPDVIELLMIVDTNDLKMVFDTKNEKLLKKTKNIQNLIIIDHHIKPKSLPEEVKLALFKPQYSSTAEIIFDFFEQQNLKIPLEVAKWLIYGIITDSGHFKYANSHTFSCMHQLLKDNEIILANLYQNLQMEISKSEKMARIKAAQRLNKIHNVNKFLIGFSHLSSYEASGCRALLDLGLDVSFIVSFSTNKGDFNIAARANQNILSQTNLHLGKIMKMIGDSYEGSGGGHDGAAGCYGNLKNYQKRHKELYVKQISKEILRKIQNMIK